MVIAGVYTLVQTFFTWKKNKILKYNLQKCLQNSFAVVFKTLDIKGLMDTSFHILTNIYMCLKTYGIDREQGVTAYLYILDKIS